MHVVTVSEFDEWLGTVNSKLRAYIDDRLDRIREYNHFGDYRSLRCGLYELRWRNGLRVYFSLAAGGHRRVALMLLGGDKNGQNKDITKARQILEREST